MRLFINFMFQEIYLFCLALLLKANFFTEDIKNLVNDVKFIEMLIF